MDDLNPFGSEPMVIVSVSQLKDMLGELVDVTVAARFQAFEERLGERLRGLTALGQGLPEGHENGGPVAGPTELIHRPEKATKLTKEDLQALCKFSNTQMDILWVRKRFT